MKEKTMRDKLRGNVSPIALAGLAIALFAVPTSGQKTDVLLLSNGDSVTGEVKGFERGKLTYSTDAMGTVSVEWPKIINLTTDKTFRIKLEDGTILFGSMRPADAPDGVSIIVDRETIEVPTQSVVEMKRIKSNFWRDLDGSIDLGLEFTQEDGQTDLSFNTDVTHRVNFRTVKLSASASLDRRDDADNITELTTQLLYQKDFGRRWFYLGSISAEENSQLELDLRTTVLGGFGRYLIRSNRVVLAVAGGAGYSRENYEATDDINSWPGIFIADFEFFSWGGLESDLSSRLTVLPIMDQWGRWRVNFVTDLRHEIAKDFYINVGLNESFDNEPPTETANKNAFTVSTSLGWSF
jgi:putative salt-induced outer membrane protein YdiY